MASAWKLIELKLTGSRFNDAPSNFAAKFFLQFGE
jgi:hypothetical protein